MSGDFEIRHGGVVAVDTASLREAADAAARAGDRAERSAGHVQWATGLLRQSELAVRSSDAAFRAARTAAELGALAVDAHSLAHALTQAANLYEAVELRAQLAAAPPDERPGLEQAIRALLADSVFAADADASRTELLAVLDGFEADWRAAASEPLQNQLSQSAMAWSVLFPPLLATAARSGTALGAALQGAVRSQGLHTARGPLRGAGDPVRLAPSSPVVTGAPAGLAAALARVPNGGSDRVRVERYDVPGGEREWVVYIAGTHAAADEAWDMRSNVQLYAGERSASYGAVVAALDDAGRSAGEPLHIVGYSQGAMIGAHLAAADDDAATLVTAGAPVVATVGESVLTVDLRHRDDPVAALAGAGTAYGTGAADSVVVTRTVPDGGALTGIAQAHLLDTYIETAQRVDESADPRAAVQAEVWQRLATGTAVATTYAVTRVSSASSEGAG